MVKTIAIGDNITTLAQVEEKFQLKEASDDRFFTEWFENLPEISKPEKEILNRIKDRYLDHRKTGSLAEGAVQLLVLSRLLEIAGFYDSPFKIRSEQTVQIAVEDKDEIYRGRIDVLVLQNQFWVAVIESKRTTFSFSVAIPQTLAYMVASPNPNQPTFGMATNGEAFIFIKLSKQGEPQYALSDDFSLYRRRNELYDMLWVLKRIGGAIASS